MSKRYGRTQKRKHRQRVAQLEEAYNRELGLVTWHAKDRDKYKHMYETVVEEIKRWWDNSVLLDPEIEMSKAKTLSDYYTTTWHKSEPMYKYNPHSIATELEIYHSTLYLLEVVAEEAWGDRPMHIMVKLGNDRIGYYIDQKALEIFGGLPRHAIEQVTAYVVGAFAEKYRRR